MTRFPVALIAAALLSLPAAAQQGSDTRATQQSTTGMSNVDETDPIGLTSTQRQ